MKLASRREFCRGMKSGATWGGCVRGVRCPGWRICLREGVWTKLDFRTTRSSLCPCSPRLPPPPPPPSLSSSGFATAPPTFSPITEIRDYNLHLKPKTVLDSHPFDWWSSLLSSSSNDLFPVNFLSSPPLFILHPPSALSLSCLQTVRASSRGRVCPIRTRGTSLADYPPFIPHPVTSIC